MQLMRRTQLACSLFSILTLFDLFVYETVQVSVQLQKIKYRWLDAGGKETIKEKRRFPLALFDSQSCNWRSWFLWSLGASNAMVSINLGVIWALVIPLVGGRFKRSSSFYYVLDPHLVRHRGRFGGDIFWILIFDIWPTTNANKFPYWTLWRNKWKVGCHFSVLASFHKIFRFQLSSSGNNDISIVPKFQASSCATQYVMSVLSFFNHFLLNIGKY